MSMNLYDIASRESNVKPDERRAHERFGGRVVVRVGTKKAVNKGLVHNLSAGGLGIYTRVVYPPGTVVALALEAATPNSQGPGQEIGLSGEVRWTRIVSGTPPEAVFEMGIRLMDPSPAYAQYFANVSSPETITEVVVAEPSDAPHGTSLAGLDRRDVARRAAVLPVEFVEPGDVAATLTRNITSGGAFISATAGLEMGMVAVVDVRLPDISEPVRALGRVVHVRPSTGPNDPGGVGLRFLRVYAGSEQRLRDYLDGLQKKLGVSEVAVLRGIDLRPN